MFTHGVASGDPTEERVVLWTRVGQAGAEVVWRLARDPALADLVGSGSVTTRAEDDCTVHVDACGLEPGTQYWYRFECGGERSEVARTRTLPAGGSLRFGMCSCAKHNAGYFNVYARIAERDDLDLVLHLGDYIYEAAQNPPKSQTPGKIPARAYVPPHECVTLADYRGRYAQYRLDPDLRALHRAHPIVAGIDDHELADGAWRGGSTEHDDGRDGPWADRRAAAFRARWEWLPLRRPDAADPERVWQSVRAGDLAELFVVDTRSRRDFPAGGAAIADPAHSQLGAEQREWLFGALRASTTRWRLLANGSIIAPLWSSSLPRSLSAALLPLKATNPDFSGPDPDQWDGYPYERDAIIDVLGERPGTSVVLSGDLHIGLASSLPGDGPPVTVELATTSITSQNLDDKTGWGTDTDSVAYEHALVEALPHLKWCDFDGHGYVVVDVNEERVRGEWWFVDDVQERSPGERRAAAFEARHGDARLVAA